MTSTLKITLTEHAIAPTRAHPTDGGLDLYATTDKQHHIPAHESTLVDTGVAAAIPDGNVGLLFARSSLPITFPGAHLANGVGVIDAKYRGTIKGNVRAGNSAVTLNAGAKFAQLVVVPVALLDIEIVDSLDDTDRGTGGFGSTGK